MEKMDKKIERESVFNCNKLAPCIPPVCLRVCPSQMWGVGPGLCRARGQGLALLSVAVRQSWPSRGHARDPVCWLCRGRNCRVNSVFEAPGGTGVGGRGLGRRICHVLLEEGWGLSCHRFLKSALSPDPAFRANALPSAPANGGAWP